MCAWHGMPVCRNMGTAGHSIVVKKTTPTQCHSRQKHHHKQKKNYDDDQTMQRNRARRHTTRLIHYAVAATGCCLPTERFAWMSLTAALMASSASMLQCSLTGGKLKCLAMSEFLMVKTSSKLRPLTLLYVRGVDVVGILPIETPSAHRTILWQHCCLQWLSHNQRS